MLYHLLHTPSHKPNALRLTPYAFCLIPYALRLLPYPLPLTPYPLSLIPNSLSKIKHILLLLLFLVVGASAALAQLHPIQVNLIAPPTLPGSISGLYQGNGLKATLILLDRYQTSIDVGIGFTVKGNGVTIEKRPDYLGETPTLLYATPKVLGEDFFASLLQQGISYNGPNRDAFDSKGTLTSGRYEVSLWAYDLNHPSVRISNLARVYLWIQKSAPPTLIAPLDKAIVYAIPQQFNWSVTMAFNGLTTPRYKFMLYELNDPNRNPADEVMSSEPFYQEEVAAPSFSYLTYHPQLIRGKRYAWRVQAVAYDQSQQEVPLFNNDGYTAIRSFSYGQDATASLKKLLALDAKSKNPYTIEVKVKPDTIGKTDTPDGLKIEYRRCGEQEWQEQEVDDDVTTIAKLTPNTEYEVRGYARMGALYGDAGPVVKARTQAPPEVKCGTTFSFKPDASTKLGSLAVGDIVTANQIPFTITKLDSNDPPYKGMAYAGISFFGGKKLSFKLVNATFNSKYELTGGTITADTIGINRFIAKKMTEQAQKEANSNEKKGDILANENTVKVDGDIKDVTSIKVDNTDKEHPKVVVTTTDGKEQVIPFKGETITLADKTGEVYTASADGKVNNIGMYDGAASGVGGMASTPQAKPKNLYGTDLLVRFTPDAKQHYGFDNPALGHDYWKEKYDTTTVAGRTEVVPVKLVAAGASDRVSVVVLGEAADKNGENLIFKTSTGMRYAATPGDKEGTLQLSLIGGAPDSRQELTAWLKKGDSTFAVGRLSIDAYQSISRRVVVVPVGDATFTQAAELAKGLNDIYNQAAVKWDATVADATLPMPEGVGESIKVDKSLLSAYSAGMRRIRSAFTGTSTYQRLGDDDIYYIFLTTLPMQGEVTTEIPSGGSEDDSSPFDGYMPYGKPFGFVRSAGMEPKKLAWVVAHELGHGAFQLQHVWLPDSRNMGGTWYKESTPNLMSYTQTPELFRWQWQDIHNPKMHSNLLADETDLGAVKLVYYLAPNGVPIGLPDDAKVCFVPDNINCPRGSVKEFVVGGKSYLVSIPDQLMSAVDQVRFLGYVNRSKQPYLFKRNFKEGDIITVRRGYNIVGENNKQTVTLEEYKYKVKEKYYDLTVSDEVISNSCISLEKTLRNLPCQTCEEQQSVKYSHVVDYSANSKGVSFLTNDELKKLQLKLEDLSKILGRNYKLYVVNSSNPKAKEAGVLKMKDPEGTTGEVIYDDASKSIQIQLDFKQPEWLSKLAVNGDCQRELVAQAVQKLHNSKAYTSLSTSDKILLEVGTTIYQGMLAVLKCSFSEESSQNRTKGEQYVAGMVFEFGSILNIEDIVTGLIQLGKGSATLVYDSYISYFKDISSIYQSSGKLDEDNFEGLFVKLSPPGMRISSELSKKIESTSKFLWKYYVKDNVPTTYWRYGQLTAMTIPIVVSAGTWAGVKGSELVTNLTRKYGTEAKTIASFADEIEQAAKIESATKKLDDLVKEYGCFTATTPVQTAHGAVPIASITDADQVLSYNHQAGKTELKRIFNIKRHVVKGLLLLGLSTGQTVEATPNHPFYVGGSYREAATLHVGDTLKAANGSAVILQSVARKDSLATVYNFTVADNLNYFVGKPGVLVHNSCLMESMVSLDKLTKAVDKLSDVVKGRYMRMYKDVDKEILGVLNSEPNIEKLLLHLTSDESVGIVGLSEIIKSSKANAEIVVDSWKKAEALGCKLKKKGFPSNSKRPDVYIAAKEYQKKFSRHADLSFEFNGISFDAIENGTLIDAKLGYGKSTFKDAIGDIDDVDNFAPEVINRKLSESLVASAKRQLDAVEGTSQQIEWYVSSDLAKRGIEELLNSRDLKGITITVKAP